MRSIFLLNLLLFTTFFSCQTTEERTPPDRERPLQCLFIPCHDDHTVCTCEADVCIPQMTDTMGVLNAGRCSTSGCVVGDDTTCPAGYTCFNTSDPSHSELVDGATSVCVLLASSNNSPNNGNNSSEFPASNLLKTPEVAMQKLFPQAAEYRSSGETVVALDDQGAQLGVGYVTAHQGFSSEVQCLTGVTTSGTILGVETLSHNESWWHRMDPPFFAQFTGIQIAQVTPLEESAFENCRLAECAPLHEAFEPYEVDTVSGATVTSDAVFKNVMTAIIQSLNETNQGAE